MKSPPKISKKRHKKQIQAEKADCIISGKNLSTERRKIRHRKYTNTGNIKWMPKEQK